jgi:undecaprenyl-diphosphatase
MPDFLVQLFAHYGYLVVFVGVLLENAGIPAPGHTVVLAGAFLAQAGTLSIWWVGGVACIAAILGDNLGYVIGRKRGRGLLERHRKLLHFSEPRQRWIEGFFARHGGKSVFAARFVTGLQTVGAIMAGVSHMSWPRFFAWNVLGAIAWSAAFCALGYFFGESWHVLYGWIGRAGLFLIIALVVIVSVVLVHRRRAHIGAWLSAHLPSWMSPRAAVVLLFSAGSAAVFVGLAQEISEHELSGFDRGGLLLVHRLASPAMDVAMRVASALGSAPVIVLGVLAVSAWCVQRHDRLAAVALPSVVAGAAILDAMLKQTFARARPIVLANIPVPASYAFPSGHAMVAAATYGMIAAVVSRELPRARWSPFVLALLLALAIGFSRVYLGAHWPTDALGGFVAGACCVLVGDAILELPARPIPVTP